eukprot:scaffold2312_cov165-Ochromonas_danica.AAC.36
MMKWKWCVGVCVCVCLRLVSAAVSVSVSVSLSLCGGAAQQQQQKRRLKNNKMIGRVNSLRPACRTFVTRTKAACDHHHEHKLFEELPFKKGSVGWGIFGVVGVPTVLVIVAWQLQNYKHGFTNNKKQIQAKRCKKKERMIGRINCLRSGSRSFVTRTKAAFTEPQQEHKQFRPKNQNIGFGIFALVGVSAVFGVVVWQLQRYSHGLNNHPVKKRQP